MTVATVWNWRNRTGNYS